MFLSALAIGCDKKTSPVESILLNYQCDLFTGGCSDPTTTFGMVGDSWTDFAVGLPIQKDLHDWLIEDHGYRLQSFVLAGHTAQADLNFVRGFDRVIRASGPNLKYMLVSLGGNDLLANNGAYWSATTGNRVEAELDLRLARLDVVHREIITQGDFLKQSLWGGDPLTWIISGYDYPNPDMDTACVRGSLNNGMPQTQAAIQTARIVDRYQTYLTGLTTRVPTLHVIELRGTLGGYPQSSPSLKYDCIHPNSLGFGILAARYAETLQGITPDR